LGIVVDGERFRLVLSRRGARLEFNRVGRHAIYCNAAEFTRLVVGHNDLPTAMEGGRLRASSRVARDLATVLFPRRPLWRPPLDDLMG